jgi:hypothetical protein
MSDTGPVMFDGEDLDAPAPTRLSPASRTQFPEPRSRDVLLRCGGASARRPPFACAECTRSGRGKAGTRRYQLWRTSQLIQALGWQVTFTH